MGAELGQYNFANIVQEKILNVEGVWTPRSVLRVRQCRDECVFGVDGTSEASTLDSHRRAQTNNRRSFISICTARPHRRRFDVPPAPVENNNGAQLWKWNAACDAM